MKEFTAQVPWPGVQPSPLGGGEASTAQEPQPESEVTPHVTPEATPRTSPITTPLVEVSDEEDGAADTDYATDMAVAQSTWMLPPYLRMSLHQHRRSHDRIFIYFSCS